MIVKLVGAAVSSAVVLLAAAPAASAGPLINVNVNVTVVVSPTFNQYQITKVTVTQANYAPNNSNGNIMVNVNVPSSIKACTARCRAGATVPVRSTRGQVR